MRPSRLALVCLLFALSACAEVEPDGPPEIVYGEVECERCRMMVADERYASAARLDGRVSVFDDLECLVNWQREQRAAAEIWVHDEATRRWLDARAASFSWRPERLTPMGSGLGAHASERALTGTDQEVLSWPELLDRRQPRPIGL